MFQDLVIQNVYLEETISIRIELCDLIVKLYDVDIIDNNFYDIMTHIILFSDDKNVKTKALDFWRKVIDVFLRHRGMIDGQFPKTTFSRELKRIIHFNKKTITNCLCGILNSLSEIGCLTIFVHILTKESDVIIRSMAKNYLEDFILLMRKYDITPSDINNNNQNSTYLSPLPRLVNFEKHVFGNRFSPFSLLSCLEPEQTPSTSLCSAYTERTAYSSRNDENILPYHKIISASVFLKFVYEDFANINLTNQTEDDFDHFLDQILNSTEWKKSG